MDLVEVDFAFEDAFLDFEHEHVVGRFDKSGSVVDFAVETVAGGVEVEFAALAEVAFIGVLVVRRVF
jgi:hypothetical protein